VNNEIQIVSNQGTTVTVFRNV